MTHFLKEIGAHCEGDEMRWNMAKKHIHCSVLRTCEKFIAMKSKMEAT